MTVIANSLGVRVGLVTRDTGDGTIEMTAPSFTSEPVYEPGDLLALEPGLLCERVITREVELAVADARTESEWADNPDAALGLYAYLGYPVYLPDGHVYGTICILHTEPRDFSEVERTMLLSARDAIHDSLNGVATKSSGDRDVEPVGMWDMDPDSRRIRLSRSMADRYGYPDDDSATDLEELMRGLPKAARIGLRERIAELVAGRVQSISFALTVRRDVGATLIKITGRAIHDSEGRVRHVVGLHWSREVAIPSSRVTQGDNRSLVVSRDGTVLELGEELAEVLGIRTDASSLTEVLAQMSESTQFRAAIKSAIRNNRDELSVLQRDWAEHPIVLTVHPHVLPDGTVCARAVPLAPSSYGHGANDPFFTRDAVTGLPTRSHLETQLRRAVFRHREERNGSRVVLSIVEVRNVDRIVHIDGHRAADATAIQIADRLRGAPHFVAALGFGHFAVLRHSRGIRAAAERQQAELSAEVGRVMPMGSVVPDITISTIDISERRDRSPAHLLSYALHEMSAAAAEAVTGGQRLTRRQREIAALVANGLSNVQIAERLGITRRTVEGHLDGIRAKLGVRNRSQITATVITHPDLLDG